MTVEPHPGSVTFTCDVCSTTARGEGVDIPPPGWAILWVRPDHGVGMAAHLCFGQCLELGAHNLAEGRSPSGRVL